MPDKSPAAVACDPLARSINSCRTMDFRSGRNNELPMMEDVLGYESYDWRLNGRGGYRNNQFTREGPSEWREVGAEAVAFL